jgi:hypothetical protein
MANEEARERELPVAKKRWWAVYAVRVLTV